MNQLWKWLRKASGLNNLLVFLKKTGMPGNPDVKIYNVLSFFFREISEDAINIRAAAVSFSLFLALFPTLLVLFTLIPYIPFRDFQATLLQTMEEIIPANAFDLFRNTITDVVNNRRSGLLSFALLLALYASSRGVLQIMNAFDKANSTFRQRSIWQKNLVALQITALLFLLLLASVFTLIFGKLLVYWIMRLMNAESGTTYFWLSVSRYALVTFLLYVSISLIYFFGPATKKRWRFFTPGSTLATLLSLLASLAFSLLINYLDEYNQLYGSIGTVIITMLWIYYNSLVLLIGFELNASIAVNKSEFESALASSHSE